MKIAIDLHFSDAGFYNLPGYNFSATSSKLLNVESNYYLVQDAKDILRQEYHDFGGTRRGRTIEDGKDGIVTLVPPYYDEIHYGNLEGAMRPNGHQHKLDNLDVYVDIGQTLALETLKNLIIEVNPNYTILPTGGFRCPAWNNTKPQVNGVPDSDHMLGGAVDFTFAQLAMDTTQEYSMAMYNLFQRFATTAPSDMYVWYGLYHSGHDELKAENFIPIYRDRLNRPTYPNPTNQWPLRYNTGSDTITVYYKSSHADYRKLQGYRYE